MVSRDYSSREPKPSRLFPPTMRQIQGDRLEQSRIRLERDIDKNIPSPPSISSDNPLDGGDDNDLSSSVDFARHNAHPQASFQSFEHLSHLDSDFYSRHGDDDSIALDPDLGQTMSTAAHHASALTLSAGLRGRNSYNHTTGRASPSGAEFDPDRPLQDMLDRRIANGISLVDATGRSKSGKSLKHDEVPNIAHPYPDSLTRTEILDAFSTYFRPYRRRLNNRTRPLPSNRSPTRPCLSKRTPLCHSLSFSAQSCLV
jgi:hypothetical protein